MLKYVILQCKWNVSKFNSNFSLLDGHDIFIFVCAYEQLIHSLSDQKVFEKMFLELFHVRVLKQLLNSGPPREIALGGNVEISKMGPWVDLPENGPLERYLKMMTKKNLHFKNVWFRLKLHNLIIKSAETA